MFLFYMIGYLNCMFDVFVDLFDVVEIMLFVDICKMMCLCINL